MGVRFWRRIIFAGAVISTCPLISCVKFGEAIKDGTMAIGAENQMMLVRSDPPSFGYYRLESQKRDYPDIGLFVKKKGVPDFLAEASNSNGHYAIFYYLRVRHAFICRTSMEEGQQVQFAGPYPITDKEYRILNDFRHTLKKTASTH